MVHSVPPNFFDGEGVVEPRVEHDEASISARIIIVTWLENAQSELPIWFI